MSAQPLGDGNVGIPMPLTTISIFKPGTEEELTYNEMGEICQCGPATMIGYDSKSCLLYTSGWKIMRCL